MRLFWRLRGIILRLLVLVNGGGAVLGEIVRLIGVVSRSDGEQGCLRLQLGTPAPISVAAQLAVEDEVIRVDSGHTHHVVADGRRPRACRLYHDIVETFCACT